MISKLSKITLNKGLIILIFNFSILIASLFLKPQFQTNDDLALIYAYTGSDMFCQPTPFTVFSTKLWGIGMVYLYKTFPMIPYEIYTLSIVLLLLVSFQIIFSKVLKNIKVTTIIFWVLLILMGTTIELQFYLELQFTMVAGILTFAGYFLLVNKKNLKEVVLSIIMIAIGSCIRPGLIPLLLLILFLFHFINLIVVKRDLKFAFRNTTLLSLTILIPILISLIDKSILSVEEKQFNDFNAFRANIVDYNILDNLESKDKIESMHWTENEIKLYHNWFYNDSILYTKGKLNRSIVNYNPLNISIDYLSIKFYINKLKEVLIQNFAIRCLILFLFLILFVRNIDIRVFYLCISNIFLFSIVFILFGLFFKIPPFRIYFLLFSISVFFIIYFVDFNEIKTKILFRTLSIVVFIYLGYGIKNSINYRLKNIQNNPCNITYSKSKLYLMWPYFQNDIINPYNITVLKKPKIMTVRLSSFSVHPAVKTQFKNFTNDIIGKDSIISFILPRNKAEWNGFGVSYTQFMKKHYDKIVLFKKIDSFTNNCSYAEYIVIDSTQNEAKLD